MALVLAGAFLFLFAVPSPATRAGLDFTFVAYDGEGEKEITCDMCGHHYSDGNTYFSTYVVNAKLGQVGIAFLRKDMPVRAKEFSYYRRPGPLSSPVPEFKVDYFQGVVVREGQTVRLKGTGFGFRLIDAFGFGCPPGVMCSMPRPLLSAENQ